MKVQELFKDKSTWTRGAMARDKDGWGVDSDSPNAVCWCLSGAIRKCYGHDSRRAITDKVWNHLSICSTPVWNDRVATFEDVVKELDI